MRMTASWSRSGRIDRIQVCGAIDRANGGLPSDHHPDKRRDRASPNPAKSGPTGQARGLKAHVLAAVKTASRAPSAVAVASLRPVLTAAARGAPLNPGRDGETVHRSNKETGPQEVASGRLSERPGKRDSHH
jgi:hypothetical protein